MATICLEGAGRRFLPIPGPILYFAKDVVLLSGLLAFGLHPAVTGYARRLAGPLPLLVGATAAWCLLTLLSPGHPSVVLGLVGTRQYVLWWIAPVVCASALLQEGPGARAERFLGILAIGVASLAAYQFTQPPTAAVNAYVWSDEPSGVATVASTGRVRVSSTFSYISGFADFVVLLVPILLAAAASAGRSSRFSYVAAGCLAAAAPMSGGRAVVLYVAASTLVVLGLSGSFRTRRGQGALLAIVLAAAGGLWAAPEAAQGVQDRFDTDETAGRFRDLALAIPVYVILETDFPSLGAGVGVMQNAGAALGIGSGWEAEAEPQRVLIELGLPGYLLVWLSRFVLAVALASRGATARSCGRSCVGRGSMGLRGLRDAAPSRHRPYRASAAVRGSRLDTGACRAIPRRAIARPLRVWPWHPPGAS